PFTIKLSPTQEITIINLGNVYKGKKNYSKYFRKKKGEIIHPYNIGYKVETIISEKKCTLSVHEGKKGPIFELKTSSESFTGSSPSKVCSKLDKNSNGHFLFGFDNLIIRELLNGGEKILNDTSSNISGKKRKREEENDDKRETK